jgi:hypothetical protein
MFMHKFGSRGDNPPSYASFIAIVGMLALAPACLNPDISDEPPLSEEVIALELCRHAGGGALDGGTLGAG